MPNTNRTDAQLPQGWELISNGCVKDKDKDKDVVLALDFAAVGRPEACFSDLVSMLDPPRETWAARQPPAGTGVEVTAGAYLQYWSEGLRESGREIRAVLGFCAGAVFAVALAGQIARWQARAPVIALLDPEPPTVVTLLRQFDQAMRGLAAVASDAEFASVREAAAGLRDAGNLPWLAAELGSLYREASRPAFERIGLKPDFQADLVTSFESLMSYLVAAGDAGATDGWGSATAIVSATPVFEPAGVARRVCADVDHAGLLRSAAVAQLVSELLG